MIDYEITGHWVIIVASLSPFEVQKERMDHESRTSIVEAIRVERTRYILPMEGKAEEREREREILLHSNQPDRRERSMMSITILCNGMMIGK